jgi:DNA-binding MarR family transcriptional regulator
MDFNFINDEDQSSLLNNYQFNQDHSKKMIWLARKYPKAQVMLFFLLDKMDNNNTLICSYKTLQEALGISTSTITRSIKLLKDNGFITITNFGINNAYMINKDLVVTYENEEEKSEESEETENQTTIIKTTEEPDFIKLYLDDILYYHDIPRSINPILQVFLKNMNYQNKLILNSSLKKHMAEEVKLTVASIDKAISKLVKGNLLIREDIGIFLFNPYLFGRGEWKDIVEIRNNITYNLKGRIFANEINRLEKNGEVED